MLNVLYIKRLKFVYKIYRKEKEKMKTRIISMILVVVMLSLTLVGCGYDFTKKDMSENAEFVEGVNAEGFKALLNALTVEDAKFGNVSETAKRENNVNDTIYSLLIKEVETTTSTSNIPKDQLKEGDFDVNDWFFYSYFATYEKAAAEEGGTPETIVIYPSKMGSSAVSIKLGYSNETLSGADQKIRDAVLAAMTDGKLNFADWAYKTTTDKTLNIYDYVNKDDKDGTNDKKVYVYVNYTVTENNTSKDYKNVKMLLDLNSDATISFLAKALLETKEVTDDKGTPDDTTDDVVIVTGKYNLNTEIAEIIDNKGTVVEKPADLAEDADEVAKEKYDADLKAYNDSLADDVKYSKITVNFAVESNIEKCITAEYTTDKEITGVDVEQGSNITLPKDTKITYYVYPVYFASVPELTAEIILKELISSLTKDSLDCLENAEEEVKAFNDALKAFNDAKTALETDEATYNTKVSTYNTTIENAVKALKEKEGADKDSITAFAALIQIDDVKNSDDPIAKIKEVLDAKIAAETDEAKKAALTAFKAAIVEDTVVIDAANAVKTAKAKVETDKKTLNGDPDGADDKAKDGAEKTYNKAFDALCAKVGDDANAETTDDAVKGAEKIVSDYKKDTYDTLAEEYENTLRTNIGKAIWKLMKDKVKVTETPEKAVKDVYNRMYEEHEYEYYTGTHSESKESNYKHYAKAGGFKQYLVENTIGAGKGDFDDAKDYLMDKAEEYVNEIVVLYFIAEELGLKLDKKEVKEYKKDVEYETYVESYGEINMLASYQAEKLFDYFLEVEMVEKDGTEEPKVDETTGARKYINITVTTYEEKKAEDSTNK